MEILIALFLLGLLCALIKVLWEYFIKLLKFVGLLLLAPFALVFTYWRSCVWIISLGMVCCTAYFMFPMVKESIRESRESKARETEARRKREMEQMQAEQERCQEARREQEARRRAEEIRQGRARRMRDKEDRIRGFAIKENPSLWSGYQTLGGQIEEQAQRVANLKQELVDFDQDPSNHPGYQKACKALEAMRAAHDEIRRKLEEAYLESRAFDALPERGKARTIGCINEAEAVFNRYKALSQERIAESEEPK